MHFFCKLVCIFLAFFCIFILAIKMDLHFFAFFCILIFGGPFLSCVFFCIFSPKYLFLLFSRKRQQPDHTNMCICICICICISIRAHTFTHNSVKCYFVKATAISTSVLEWDSGFTAQDHIRRRGARTPFAELTKGIAQAPYSRASSVANVVVLNFLHS